MILTNCLRRDASYVAPVHDSRFTEFVHGMLRYMGLTDDLIMKIHIQSFSTAFTSRYYNATVAASVSANLTSFEWDPKQQGKDYEVYEKIGDKYVAVAAVEFLYGVMPNSYNNVSTVTMAEHMLVSSVTLAGLAKRIGLDKWTRSPTGYHVTDSVLEDIFEAVCGVTALEVNRVKGSGWGILLVSNWLKGLFATHTRIVDNTNYYRGPMTMLNNFSQDDMRPIEYDKVGILHRAAMEYIGQRYTVVAESKDESRDELAVRILISLMKVPYIRDYLVMHGVSNQRPNAKDFTFTLLN